MTLQCDIRILSPFLEFRRFESGRGHKKSRLFFSEQTACARRSCDFSSFDGRVDDLQYHLVNDIGIPSLADQLVPQSIERV